MPIIAQIHQEARFGFVLPFSTEDKYGIYATNPKMPAIIPKIIWREGIGMDLEERDYNGIVRFPAVEMKDIV